MQTRYVSQMYVTIAAIGRMKGHTLTPTMEEYLKRCPWEISCKEHEVPAGVKGLKRQQAEGEWLLKQCPPGPGNARIVVLDERGKPFTSQIFAETLRRWQEEGTRHLTFLLGGADGHTETIHQHADLTLSLSTLTMPHKLARLVLAEQLYRAGTILSGHPYHR